MFRGGTGYFSKLQWTGFFFESVTVINTHAILSTLHELCRAAQLLLVFVDEAHWSNKNITDGLSPAPVYCTEDDRNLHNAI